MNREETIKLALQAGFTLDNAWFNISHIEKLIDIVKQPVKIDAEVVLDVGIESGLLRSVGWEIDPLGRKVTTLGVVEESLVPETLLCFAKLITKRNK